MRLSFHEYEDFKKFLGKFRKSYDDYTGGLGAKYIFWGADECDDGTSFVIIEVVFFQTEDVIAWSGFHGDPKKLIKEVAEIAGVWEENIFKGGVSI